MKKDRRREPFRALIRDSRGASAVEYGLILSLVFLAVMGAIASLGSAVQSRWNNIAERVSSI
ncbi:MULTISPECIES: Flp family type IVb pilin [unclassified Sphingomonas]|uniref:Flp family type IVb pilin n=1 Tax=unclassified Sphingomonas TaxID=196159 RepID=UPI0006FF2AB5|nr:MULTISPECIES: Flp family type IVb pilin [unclassified Sphingomonas]KQX18498.1 pilus assembly protein [Sphingomonas sp. Root1294]KQY72178.1 pilus assembly protein [Sphingomonas sp. Root50]KRB94549.1 pilus assembly protein [Sphingomonas sp. Root720]